MREAARHGNGDVDEPSGLRRRADRLARRLAGLLVVGAVVDDRAIAGGGDGGDVGGIDLRRDGDRVVEGADGQHGASYQLLSITGRGQAARITSRNASP